MNTAKRYIATLELLLIFPGSLFMLSLFARDIQPVTYEPAHTAQRLVDWFSQHPVLALDIGLITLPFVAFIIGGAAVLRAWRTDPELREAAQQTLTFIRRHFAALLIAAATLTAGGILAIVALHVITD